MRVRSRVALLFVFVFSLCAPALLADHLKAECPLSLVDSTAPITEFATSPHGVFRNGSVLHVLRGNILTTYNVSDSSADVGNLQVAREDFVGSLAGRETNAGVAFSNGFLFISSEAGLEIFDLRNVRGGAGGAAPTLVVRRAGLHYRRLAVDGNRLAALYPMRDFPCYPKGLPTEACFNTIDIYNIATISNPTLVGSIDSRSRGTIRGFNDIAFNFGFLFAIGDTPLNAESSLFAYNISNPAAPVPVTPDILTSGQYLLSNGADFIAAIDDNVIHTYRFNPVFALVDLTRLLTIPSYLTIGRGNEIRFHPQMFYDDANARLITMIEEVNPMTLKPARTIAFDVIDFTVLQFEGSAERVYEDVTDALTDEVKYNPTVVGPFVYVVGEESGLQEWGACNRVVGRIELDSPTFLTCGGAALHGWVSGTQKVVNVELFLDNTPLGAASVSGPPRADVSSTTPVFNWRINVNLDTTAKGEHLLRAIGTDALGQRKQFAFKRLYFPGSPNNCTVPKRRAVR
jgi:hypothetical protein